MPSKYSKLRDKLPAFEQESTFQNKVDHWKAEYAIAMQHQAEDYKIIEYKVADLAEHYTGYKQEKDAYEEKIGVLNVALEALSQMIIERMQADDMEKVSLSDGSTCYVSYEVYPSVKDKGLLIDWVKKNKLSESLSLPWQTLRGLCNELSLNGKPLPRGVEAFMKVSARIRKNGSE